MNALDVLRSFITNQHITPNIVIHRVDRVVASHRVIVFLASCLRVFVVRLRGAVNAAGGSVCRQPEPTLRASNAPTYSPRLILGHSNCCASLLRLRFLVSSDCALRSTTAARTRLPCRRSRRPHGEATKSSRRRVPSRHRVSWLRAFVSSCLRGVSSWYVFVPSWFTERAGTAKCPWRCTTRRPCLPIPLAPDRSDLSRAARPTRFSMDPRHRSACA